MLPIQQLKVMWTALPCQLLELFLINNNIPVLIGFLAEVSVLFAWHHINAIVDVSLCRANARKLSLHSEDFDVLLAIAKVYEFQDLHDLISLWIFEMDIWLVFNMYDQFSCIIHWVRYSQEQRVQHSTMDLCWLYYVNEFASYDEASPFLEEPTSTYDKWTAKDNPFLACKLGQNLFIFINFWMILIRNMLIIRQLDLRQKQVGLIQQCFEIIDHGPHNLWIWFHDFEAQIKVFVLILENEDTDCDTANLHRCNIPDDLFGKGTWAYD